MLRPGNSRLAMTSGLAASILSAACGSNPSVHVPDLPLRTPNLEALYTPPRAHSRVLWALTPGLPAYRSNLH